jgi:hypothetical protein
MIGGVAVSRTRHGLRCRPRVTVSAQAKRPDVPTRGEGHNTPPGMRPAAASAGEKHDPAHRSAGGALDAGEQLARPAAAAVMARACGAAPGQAATFPGADFADDDAKLVGATAASHRQVDQWHVAVSTGHQGPEIKPDGMLAGATSGRQPHSHVGGIAVSAEHLSSRSHAPPLHARSRPRSQTLGSL